MIFLAALLTVTPAQREHVVTWAQCLYTWKQINHGDYRRFTEHPERYYPQVGGGPMCPWEAFQ